MDKWLIRLLKRGDTQLAAAAEMGITEHSVRYRVKILKKMGLL